MMHIIFAIPRWDMDRGRMPSTKIEDSYYNGKLLLLMMIIQEEIGSCSGQVVEIQSPRIHHLQRRESLTSV